MEDLTELVEVEEGGVFILHPGEFVLGSTLEQVRLPGDVVASLEGKSSLGRLGLLIHSTAARRDRILAAALLLPNTARTASATPSGDCHTACMSVATPFSQAGNQEGEPVVPNSVVGGRYTAAHDPF